MALTFDSEAAERWTSLCASSQSYEQEVRSKVASVLRLLAESPQRHRIGAIQFTTTPTTWAKTVEITAGAPWMVVWTVKDADICILRIEPTSSF